MGALLIKKEEGVLTLNKRREGGTKRPTITKLPVDKERHLDPNELLAGLGSPTEQALFQLHEVVGAFEKALPPPRFFRVVIFGSARVTPEDREYQDIAEFSRKITEQIGCDIVTGGGPGIMEAASRGARDGRSKRTRVRSVGVCIDRIRGRDEPANGFLSHQYRHGNFFTRLHQFARLGGRGVFIVSEAAGIGSKLELAMIEQLLQVGHLDFCRLVAIGDMWREHMEWQRKYMVPRFISPEEMAHVELVATTMDALPIVAEAHQQFRRMKAAG